MLSESARNCAFVSHARLLELCFLGGLVCRRSFWTLFGFKISAQSDGEEKDKDNPTTTNQTTANDSTQAKSPPSCSLSSVLR